METITEFRRHRVLRPVRVERTDRFARDKSPVLERVADLVRDVWHSRFRRKVQKFNLAKCLEFVAKLERELEGPVPALRMLEVATWYEQHWDDEYVPVIDSGKAFYKKFNRLEAVMRARTRRVRVPSTREVTDGLFNGSAVLAEAFLTDVVGRARGLDLGAVEESELVVRLGAMCAEIRDARREGGLGPLDLLGQYIDWLGERDWRMTLRVFDMRSPAFQQFRRELASLHPYGHDPITGRG